MERHFRPKKGFSPAAVTMALLMGVTLGAGTALLIAPESGPRMRRRLRQSARIAQEEFADVALETREAFEALGKDARQTIRQTASRLSAALGATKEALTTEGRVLKGFPPHG